jgi:hypothetical protein
MSLAASNPLPPRKVEDARLDPAAFSLVTKASLGPESELW